MTFEEQVTAVLADIHELLLAKNKAYGNSALNPVRIFSTANPSEQIRVRIDDKLSRLARGTNAGEDVVRDLIGYLVLLRIAETEGNSAKRAQKIVIAGKEYDVSNVQIDWEVQR